VQMMVKDGSEEWTTTAFDALPAADQNRSLREVEGSATHEDAEL
jgi:hypothetical protein